MRALDSGGPAIDSRLHHILVVQLRASYLPSLCEFLQLSSETNDRAYFMGLLQELEAITHGKLLVIALRRTHTQQ